MDFILDWALRRARRHGLGGGSRAWLGLGAVALAIKWVRRSNSDRVVYSEELTPGSTLVIEHQAEASPFRR
ncbi:MAG: hypothetical protein ACYCS7_04335 [Acidimicrobiales bacterium]